MTRPRESHQWALIAAAAGVSAVLGALATLLLIGYWRQKDLQIQATQETIRANHAAAQARDAANRGLRARDEAEALVGYILEQLGSELREIDRSDLLEEAAQRASDYFDNLPQDLISSETKEQQASVLLALAQARYQQNDSAQAIAAVRRSIRLLKDLSESGDLDGAWTRDYGRALGELGLFQNQVEDHEGARETFHQVLRVFQKAPPQTNQLGWWEHGKAKAHLGLGESHRLEGNYADARAEYAQAITHITAALAYDPDEISWLHLLMNAHNNTGVTLMHDKDYVRAEVSLTNAIAANRMLIRIEPQDRRWEKELGTGLLNLGSLLHLRKEFDRAEPFLREALAIRQGLAAWDTKNTRWLLQLAHAWNRLAVFEFDVNRPRAALTSVRNALATHQRYLTIEPGEERVIQEMRDYALKFAARLGEAGLNEDALRILQEAASFAEANRAGELGADAWTRLLSSLYADIERLGGRSDTTAMLVAGQKRLALEAEALGSNPDDPDAIYAWALACLDLGRAYRQAGFVSSALACFRLARLALRDAIPQGWRRRELWLDEAERLDLSVSIELGHLEPPVTLLPAGASWRYWDDPEAPASGWQSPGFNDAAWRTGNAPLGYGQPDLATAIHFGDNSRGKNLTAWFRTTFAVGNVDTLSNIRLGLRRDDGAVVYLNGVEWFRDGLPDGPVHPGTLAMMAREDEETIYHVHTWTASDLSLRQGQNVLAVEVHQNEPMSSDLALDLEVLANVTLPESGTGLDLSELTEILGHALPSIFEDKLKP